jgi:hypothetical protein
MIKFADADLPDILSLQKIEWLYRQAFENLFLSFKRFVFKKSIFSA